MKMTEKHRTLGIASEGDAFNYLLNTLKDTIRTYDFFVSWGKVLGNVEQIEVSLNILTSLIGKEDISTKLKILIRRYPEIVPVLPILLAVRDKNIKIADINGDITYSFSRKSSYTDEEIDKIVFFSEKSGLLKIMENKNIKNIVDYAIGVEVGLDTNARKNRSGSAMESLTESYIRGLCEKHSFTYLSQPNVEKIKNEFNRDVATDKSDRNFDFAIKTPGKTYVIEVNYYSGGGSKLKSVAGEFKTLFNLVQDKHTGFIWITDGVGWRTAERPLLEAFNATDFIMNLNMIENGLLEEIILHNL